MSELVVRNRQRVRRVHLRLLRQITESALTKLPGVRSSQLGIHLVGAPEMTRLNETFLRHAGSTDVIAFDYATPPAPPASRSVSKAWASS
jgi:ssRNA-specific RNase YbeY (16S rRNA maturation enzyme)